MINNVVGMLEGWRAASARKETTRKARRSEAFMAGSVAKTFSELSHGYSSMWLGVLLRHSLSVNDVDDDDIDDDDDDPGWGRKKGVRGT